MKQSILSSLAALIITLGTIGSLSAQVTSKTTTFRVDSNNNDLAKIYSTKGPGTIAMATESAGSSLGTAKSDLKSSKANFKAAKGIARAAKNFERSYSQVSNAKWTAGDNAMFASFMEDSVRTRIAYDKNGRWISTFRYMPASRIPSHIRSAVEEKYPSERLVRGVHIRNQRMDYYFVQAEGVNMLKELAVYEGEVIFLKKLSARAQ